VAGAALPLAPATETPLPRAVYFAGGRAAQTVPSQAGGQPL